MVAWTPVPNNNDTNNHPALLITRYTVTMQPSGDTMSTNGSSVVFSGLSNGLTVTFTVTSFNGIVEGPPSLPTADVTPATVPDVVGYISATGGAFSEDNEISWIPPWDTGGVDVLSYKLNISDGTSWFLEVFAADVRDYTHTSAGLGVRWSYTIWAVNAAGEGLQSTDYASAGEPYACNQSLSNCRL